MDWLFSLQDFPASATAAAFCRWQNSAQPVVYPWLLSSAAHVQHSECLGQTLHIIHTIDASAKHDHCSCSSKPSITDLTTESLRIFLPLNTWRVIPFIFCTYRQERAVALHHTLQIASALHDIFHYLVSFSRLGNTDESSSSSRAADVAADWGGTEGIGGCSAEESIIWVTCHSMFNIRDSTVIRNNRSTRVDRSSKLKMAGTSCIFFHFQVFFFSYEKHIHYMLIICCKDEGVKKHNWLINTMGRWKSDDSGRNAGNASAIMGVNF